MVRSMVHIDLEIRSMTLIGSGNSPCGKNFGSAKAPANVGQRCGNGFQVAEMIFEVHDQWNNVKRSSGRCDLQI